MSDQPYTVIRSVETLDGQYVEVTVTTPDFTEATVTMSKRVAESPLYDMTIRSMLASRKRTQDELRSVEE